MKPRALSLFVALSLAACGGTVNGTGGTGGGGAGGGGGTGGSTQSGDCDSPADCGGAACLEIVPGGFRACDTKPPEATTCGDPTNDDCCSSADCPIGACFDLGDLPACGGPVPSFNACLADACATAADCAQPGSPLFSAYCVEAGAVGNAVKACLLASCETDADCDDPPGGSCAPITNPCCGAVAGLGCVYADGCRTDGDCAAGYCELDFETGRGLCKAGGPICPL